jgi:hypothetical protein
VAQDGDEYHRQPLVLYRAAAHLAVRYPQKDGTAARRARCVTSRPVPRHAGRGWAPFAARLVMTSDLVPEAQIELSNLRPVSRVAATCGYS